jgi:hypothetical protein
MHHPVTGLTDLAMMAPARVASTKRPHSHLVGTPFGPLRPLKKNVKRFVALPTDLETQRYAEKWHSP